MPDSDRRARAIALTAIRALPPSIHWQRILRRRRDHQAASRYVYGRLVPALFAQRRGAVRTLQLSPVRVYE